MSHFARKKRDAFVLCHFHTLNCIPQSLHPPYQMKIQMLFSNIIRVKLDNSNYITYVYFSYDKLMYISFYFSLITFVSIYCISCYLLFPISIYTIISKKMLYQHFVIQIHIIQQCDLYFKMQTLLFNHSTFGLSPYCNIQ